MLSFLKKTRKTASSKAFTGQGAKGARAYAIGDVHGRLDLLVDLLEKIEADNAARNPCKTWLIMLGDLIDRGPDSRGVIKLLLERPPRFATPVMLMGNHEEMLLRAMSGEPEILPSWLTYGGLEFAGSYGLSPEMLAGRGPAAVEWELRHSVPREHLAFLSSFHDTFRFGDYLFVHAGIRPGLPFDQQQVSDFRWIREGFLDSTDEHGMIVVHGHTIVEAPDDRGNRIALDIGAYRSGRLAAIGIEATERWFLQSEIR